MTVATDLAVAVVSATALYHFARLFKSIKLPRPDVRWRPGEIDILSLGSEVRSSTSAFHTAPNNNEVATRIDNLPALDAYKPAVLIVEDNALIGRMAQLNLRKSGVRTTLVADGQAALVELERNNYALVLMDLDLPKLNGIETTRRIRNRDRRIGKHTIVIATTADENAQQCFDGGMDDHMTKPVNYAAVIDKWVWRTNQTDKPIAI